jgi:putative phosphoesterase
MGGSGEGVYIYQGMKIGVLSDTHLHRVTDEFREIFETYLSDTDLILHAGDVVSTEVIDFLERRPFFGVRGNMDPPEVRERLAGKRMIELGPFRLGLIHGWGSTKGLEERVWPEFRGVDVIVYGHSHHPANQVGQGVVLFNPGTATGYTPSGANTLGILELGETVHGEIITL